MSAARRQQVLEILDATLAEPPATRSTYLAEACGEDGELRDEVESLLALESEADGFLGEPAVRLDAESPPLEEGLRIGPYRVVELLGRGGMGSVYRAVREDDFEKQVAIKLLQRDLVSDATVRRFHNERQILARLEHPSVARLLDGGTTDDGRPYLVMEYVEGVPIDEYCDAHALSTRERLKLFREVCSALAFAHRSLIVHRDLKPGNILITASGAPKLLDFGIAKLIDPDDATRPDLTRAQEQPMTPRYASPEQVLRQPITTASDIYGLGALLYRLLTGRLPCGLESCRFGEIPWRIVEHEPVKPSVAVGRAEEVETADGTRRWTPESVAGTRDGDPEKLRRRLAGDVDAIVMKALRKEPQHRYASVEQLSDDIGRHLSGRPVAARRGTMLYLTAKFLRRHRLGVAAALLVVLATIAFIVRERQRFEVERERAARMTNVLEGLVAVAGPDRRVALEETRQLLKQLEGEPRLYAELLSALANINYELGHSEEARELLNESLEVFRQVQAEDLVGMPIRINNLGVLSLNRGEDSAAEALFRRALELYEALGDETPQVSSTLNNLATALLYRGAFDEAEAFYRRGLEIRQRNLGRDHPDVATSLLGLGALQFARGDEAAAEPLLREALDIRRKAYGAGHTKVASALTLLGRVRFARGDPREAEELYRRALEIRRRELADDHHELLATERHYAALLLAEGELAPARALIEHVIAGLARTRSAGDWRIADAESVLGALLTAEGRFEEAEPCVVESYRALSAGRDLPVYVQEARSRVFELYEAWGRPEKAAPFEDSRSPPPVAAEPVSP